MTHTPGPWKSWANGDGERIHLHGDSNCIGETYGPNRRENARLIAAAPALLEALERIAKRYKGLSWEEMPAEELESCADIARDAIALAKGEEVKT